MDVTRQPVSRRFLAALAVMLVVCLVLSAGIGVVFGNSKTGQPIDPGAQTDPADPSQGTDPGTDPGPGPAPKPAGVRPGRNIGGTGAISRSGDKTDPGDDTPLTPQQKAAAMQDYTIDPRTGKAREIKVCDKNYLLLINRTHPLAESYVPDDLITVNRVASGAGVKGETDKLRRDAALAFESMVDAAEEAGIKIRMRVGYQSYEYHKTRIYDRYVSINGQAYADTYSCAPGLSEHQTGLALDISGATDSYKLSQDFLSTEEGKWVRAHCFEYGFILRYTEGTDKTQGSTTGFVAEPWHLRYVGTECATEIMAKNLSLEEYLGILR